MSLVQLTTTNTGSERLKDSKSEGAQLKETGSINRSPL